MIDILEHSSKFDYCKFVGKKLNCSSYLNLSNEIPDKYLIIEECFINDSLLEVEVNYHQFLGEYYVYPILEILGGNVICIGYGKDNDGIIYYHDFDFGFFELNKDLRGFEENLFD